MNLKELESALQELGRIMDDSVIGVSDAAEKAQQEIYAAATAMLNRFATQDGRFTGTDNYRARLNLLEDEINKVLDNIYAPAISDYLDTFSTIEETNIALHKSYNDLEVDVKKLAPARRLVYDRTRYYLKQGIRESYVMPAKLLLMQQVTTGITLEDAEKQLRQWDQGKYTTGNAPAGRPAPNLQRYAVQLSRDSLYQFDGQINNIVKNEYDLNAFIYVGDIIEDSRPLCRHLVSLHRKIFTSELPELLQQFPEGLYPDTNEDNFMVYRGGFSCRHQTFAVRKKE